MGSKKNSARYLIVVPESGEMYLAPLDDGVRAVARQLIGARHVDTAPCIPDTRFTVLFSEWTTFEQFNATASMLASEPIMGPCVLVRGDRPDALYGMTRDEADRAMRRLAALVAEGGDDRV